MSVFVIDHPLFRAFAFYATASTLKMLLMALLTSRRRLGSKVFANPEDLSLSTGQKRVIIDDPGVERIRRNHLNDIENIIPFVLLGSIYICTQPHLSTALWHFRVFFASRIFHTISYQMALPQPSRALSFFAGMVVNLSMGVQILMATM